MAQDEHHHVDLDEIAKDNIGRDRSAYLTNELDQTYLPVVDRLLAGCDSESSAILTDDLKKVIGSIVTFQQPLPLECISSLLDVERGTIDRVLNGLHSAFDVPADPAQPVRLLHPSFRDFLLAPEKKGIFKFWVDEHRAHTFVARQCLKLLSRSGVLQQDICGLRSPGAWRNTVDDQTLKRCLPAEVRYACRYWIRHLIKGSTEDQDVWESAFVFFKVHFLHWLEAMSLIRRLPDALTAVTALQKKAAFDTSYVELSSFLVDAGRFILAFKPIIEDAPLQTYCAGLVFTPENSAVRTAHQHARPHWIVQIPRIPAALEGGSGWVNHFEFSPDGRRMLSETNHVIVRLWDTESGELVATLKDNVAGRIAYAFSPDSRLVAFGLGEVIELVSAESGEVVATLRGPRYWMGDVAFSSDCRQVVAGSRDGNVRLWNVESGELVLTLEGHSWFLCLVAFSPDGRRVASMSADRMVKLWDAEAGKEVATLEEHSDSVSSITFSSDGRQVVLWSWDRDVTLWDAESGGALQTLPFDTHVRQLESSGVRLPMERKVIHTDAYGRFSDQTGQAGLHVSDRWIMLGPQRLIWLPPEHRATCYVVDGQKVFLGHKSGQVSFFRLDVASVPRV